MTLKSAYPRVLARNSLQSSLELGSWTKLQQQMEVILPFSTSIKKKGTAPESKGERESTLVQEQYPLAIYQNRSDITVLNTTNPNLQ